MRDPFDHDDWEAEYRDDESTPTAPTPLPKACAKPCPECPWLRTSLGGWLGPIGPEDWVSVAHSEEAVACHQTIPSGGGWGPRTRQCKGLAIFRNNVCKSPRRPDDAARDSEPDRETVFARNAEFIEHHSRGPLAERFAREREDGA